MLLNLNKWFSESEASAAMMDRKTKIKSHLDLSE